MPVRFLTLCIAHWFMVKLRIAWWIRKFAPIIIPIEGPPGSSTGSYFVDHVQARARHLRFTRLLARCPPRYQSLALGLYDSDHEGDMLFGP